MAIPAIARQFHVPPTDLQWVISGYMLSIGALMVTAGRLADQHQQLGAGLEATLQIGLAAGVERHRDAKRRRRARSRDRSDDALVPQQDVRQRIERLKEIAREKNCTASQLALAWVLAEPGITAPIIGSTITAASASPRSTTTRSARS